MPNGTKVVTTQGSPGPRGPLGRPPQQQQTVSPPGHTDSPESDEGPNHPTAAMMPKAVCRSHGGMSTQRGSHTDGGGPKTSCSQPQGTQAETVDGDAVQKQVLQDPAKQQQGGDQKAAPKQLNVGKDEQYTQHRGHQLRGSGRQSQAYARC